MSEERFDRIETQISNLSNLINQGLAGVNQAIIGMDQSITGMDQRMIGMDQSITGMDQRMIGMDQSITGVNQAITNLNQRMTNIEDRMEVLETTLSATMRGGFNNLRGIVNDIDADLAKVEQRAEDTARKVRRLNQRLMYLEGRTEEGDNEVT
jgi:archaellum component FlaC